MFSNWDTTYNKTNKDVVEKRQEFKKTELPEWFVPKYHNYHRAFYNTEHIKSFGLHGDRPVDKFTKTQVDGKFFNDNYDLGKGTNKTGNTVVGYTGMFMIYWFRAFTCE